MAETNDYDIDECGGVACAFLQNLFRLLSPQKLPYPCRMPAIIQYNADTHLKNE